MRHFHVRRCLPVLVVILGTFGSLYCAWSLHRVSAGVLMSDDHWPRAWPYPDHWLAALNDCYDARFPVEPGLIKLHSELQRVRLTVAAALAACLLVVFTGMAIVAIKRADAGNAKAVRNQRLIT